METPRPRGVSDQSLGKVLRLRWARLTNQAGALVAIGLVISLFCQLQLGGGDQLFVSLVFSGLWLGALAGLLLQARWYLDAMGGGRHLRPIAALFGLVVAWGFVQALPLTADQVRAMGGPHDLAPAISIEATRTLAEALKLCGLGALFAIAVGLGRNDDRARLAFNTLGVLSALYTAHGLYIGTLAAPDRLLSASLGNPNTAATVFAAVVTFAWSAVLRSGLSLIRGGLADGRLNSLILQAAPWALLMAGAAGALMLTGSRGGLMACGAGVLAATLAFALGEYQRPKIAASLVGVAGAACLALLAYLASGGAVAARLGRLDAAFANRGTIVQIYLENLGDVPWTGFGLGTFAHINSLLAAPGRNAILWDLGALHNVYLQWIYEAGWFGAGSMLAVLALAHWQIAQGLMRRRFGRSWMAAALGLSAVVLAHGAIDYALQLPAIAAIWSASLGFAVGVARPSRR